MGRRIVKRHKRRFYKNSGSSIAGLAPFVWYEPSEALIFQNSDGTGAITADSQPVGFMADLAGSARNLLQAAGASRPTFRIVGGLRFLSFTTAQSMQSVAFGPVSQPIDIVAAIRITGAAGGADNLALGSSAPRCSIGTATNEVVGYAGGVADVRSALLTNALGVVTFRAADPNSTTKIDNGSFATPVAVGTNSFGQASLNAGASAGCQFDLFGWAAFPQLSASDLARAISYFMAKQGR